MAQTVTNLPAMWETWVRSLCWEGPLEKGIATHSSILAWRIPWTEEPGGLQSAGLQRVGHAWSNWAYACVRVFPLSFFFSCNKNFKDLSSQQLSHMQYRCINHSQHAVHYTPRTYLFHNWKSLLVTPFTYFFYPRIPWVWQSPMSLVGFFFPVFFFRFQI